MVTRRNGASIRRRIFSAFLAVSILSLLVSGAIAAMGIFRLRDASNASNNLIGTQAAQSSGEALIRQALGDITALAGVKAQLIGSSLEDTVKTLTLLSELISDIYRNKENYRLIPFMHPKFHTDGGRQMQWILSPGMTAYTTGLEQDLVEAGILEETYLLGNMGVLYETVMRSNPNISSIYTTSKSGLNTGYDDKSLSKITKDDVSTHVVELRSEDVSWYQEPKRTLKPHITDTYLDRFGRGLTITMSAPYTDEDGALLGVVGLDMLIGDLVENVLNTTVGESGYAVLLKTYDSGDAMVIAAPGLNSSNEANMKAFLGESATATLEQMRSAQSGTVESMVAIGGKLTDVYIVWAPVPVTGWTYAIVLPSGEISAPSDNIQDLINGMTDGVVRDADMNVLRMFGMLAVLLMCAMGLVALVARNVSRKITGPITALIEDISAVSNGNFNYTSTIHTGDEIEMLSLSFENMAGELQDYIKNLAKVTADKERIATELNVATRIQASMLPCIFPPFPERHEFDLYASMLPAREVGGDFYDFFLVDNDTLAIVIADVSDKGVPAALFMVIAKTIIKNNACSCMRPGEVFAAVNNRLCENNEEGMFVTAFMGFYHIKTHQFVYVNAGHNQPLLLKSGGDYAFLTAKPNLVMAGMEGTVYKEHELTLEPGDSLFLYTDGVTEAVNRDLKLFSDARLLAAVNRCRTLPLKDQLAQVKKEIDAFADGAEQADDITMLALKINDPG